MFVDNWKQIQTQFSVMPKSVFLTMSYVVLCPKEPS